MNRSHLDTFVANRLWLNEFFEGVKQVFERISTILAEPLSLTDRGFYYFSPRYVPALPAYYAMGLGGGEFVVQCFAVFDRELIDDRGIFDREVSFFVVKHGASGQVLYLNDYGLQAIRGGALIDSEQMPGILSGRFRNGTPFQAFQVGLEHFLEGRDLDEAIDRTVLQPLMTLPSLPAVTEDLAQ